MALAVSNIKTEFTGGGLHVYGTITPTGNYATGGDTLSLAGLDQVKSSSVPDRFYIQSQKAGQTNMFVYNYVPGASQALGKMQVFTGAAAQTALTELSAGAYPPGVTADVIVFEAIFLGRNI